MVTLNYIAENSLKVRSVNLRKIFRKSVLHWTKLLQGLFWLNVINILSYPPNTLSLLFHSLASPMGPFGQLFSKSDQSGPNILHLWHYRTFLF